MIALLLALVTIGAPPCQSGPHDWQIEYADGVVVEASSSDGMLSFEERLYWSWRARYRYTGYTEWLEWSQWRPAIPYPGDSDGDCIVGNSDFILLRQHIGESCQ